ncbi:MAG: hypothetical protein CBD58_00145 [bacterium TMED198]|nr:MAG: hypothetical protein CBD58_00145 [bacterium TMED198]
MKLLVFLILIFSCSNKPETKGKDDVVLIFISEEDKEILEPFILDLFDKAYLTPQEEKEFKVKFKKPLLFNKFLKHPNILCISLKNPIDSTGDVLSMHLVKEQEKKPIIIFNDPYARNQTLAVINEFDSISAIKSLFDYKDWIVNEFRETWEKRILADIVEANRNEKIEDKINDYFDLDIIIPKDYEVIKSNRENNFFWIGDDYPYKWVILYMDKNDAFVSPKLALDNIVNKLAVNDIKINVTQEGRRFKVFVFKEEKMKSISGLYEHPEKLVGGPFQAFFREIGDSTFVMFSMVNNPGKEKLFYLKQFEVIFKYINKSY